MIERQMPRDGALHCIAFRYWKCDVHGQNDVNKDKTSIVVKACRWQTATITAG